MAHWKIPWFRFFFRNSEDDISSSEKLVHPLPLSKDTKQFVLALKAPESSSVVYILAAERLSEQSVADADFLIRSVKPEAVVVQIEPGSLTALRQEEQNLEPESLAFPTSALDVLKECFSDRTKTCSYEGRASVEVVKKVFGTSFHGHVLKAKAAAQDSNSSFSYLETPHRGFVSHEGSAEVTQAALSSSLHEDPRSLTSRTALTAGTVSIPSEISSSRNFPVSCSPEISKIAQYKLDSVFPSLASSLTNSQNSSQVTPSSDNVSQLSASQNCIHQCPSFALTLYPLLQELQCFYHEMPGIGHSLKHAQKMLFDIESGREVDEDDLVHAQKFRLAVEALRMALNSEGRRPLKKDQSTVTLEQFEILPYEDRCHVILVQALQQQLKRFSTVVAIMDASSLSGIRKHWTTRAAPEVAALAEHCFACSNLNGVDGEVFSSKKIEKQLTMVGASTVTAMGIASLSWWTPVSSFTKIIVLKMPTIAKIGLMQTKRNAMFAAFKAMYPASKFVTPGKLFLSPASHASTILKSATSAGKVRIMSQSLVATFERASLSAIRTAFYCLMRKHHGKSVGVQPWLILGSSMVAGAGIWVNHKGIESAIEAAPSAASVARLGRGLENLQHTFLSLSQRDQTQVWSHLYSALYGLSKH